MLLKEVFSSLPKVASALGKAIGNTDIGLLIKAGVLVGTAAFSLYTYIKARKEKEEAVKKAAQEEDVMRDFMGFACETTDDEKVQETLQKIRRNVSKDCGLKKKKKSKKKNHKNPNRVDMTIDTREALNRFQQGLEEMCGMDSGFRNVAFGF